MSSFLIRRLDAEEVAARADELAALLIDAVESGASVSYIAVPSREEARAWARAVAAAARGNTSVFVGEADGAIRGTVQMSRAPQPNQPHRADIAKLLVHRAMRRQGLGEALMREAESRARALGITLLTLDTARHGEAWRLYERIGYQKAGIIPNYAVGTDGKLLDTIVYYKDLGSRDAF